MVLPLFAWVERVDLASSMGKGIMELTKGVMSMVAIPTQYVVDEKGRKTAVLLSVRRYEKMLEDLHDLAIVAERSDEPVITLEEMKRRLKKDGGS